ncbi:uncharacterized protein EDB91DRAFT_1192061 [Suillus paluster]|uniref:uncharacterized protein n=1 Tax=Suillus paluster TaxID=48578 RepID=UPI001B875FB8|nr:uncharacterized protein EDB91DRAFT_1192061 [Suillus paluster]KAG1756292.1 hypothetical protein EDB91DRAFT_1192061 [Suillus paluster]
MTELERAVEALKAAVKHNGIDKRVGDVVSQFTSYLVLLKSSSPSSQSISKLRSILRRSLLPLYAAVPGPALQLSSAVLRKVIDDKLRNALNAQNSQLSASWNEVAIALLSGVLDFLDKKCDDMTKEATASAFYPTICTLFFYQDTSLTILPRTQTTAYSLLHETLAKHPGNQRRLRDHAVLGGSLIGIAISRSKDYLVVEALLTIVGWLIPPTYETEQGKAKRTEFINELFGSEKHFSCSQELVGILQYISSSHWEDTTMKVIDALARSDITFPQPFSLDEVHVCGKAYPQATAFDRLYLDRDCFLANVIEQDDVCESLKISYGHIRSVTIDISKAPPPNKAIVHVDLTAPPVMGEVPLNILVGQSLYLKFDIEREDLSRLMEALRRRGVVKLSFLGENLPKQTSIRRSVGLAHGIRLTGDSPPPPHGSQYEDKVKHVENVYETNFPDDARSVAAQFKQESLSARHVPSPTPAKTKPDVLGFKKHASVESPTKTVPRPRPVSKTAKKVAPLPMTPPRKSPAVDITPHAVHVSVFGESNDELSEISDDDPAPKPVAKARLVVHSAQHVKAEPIPSLNAKSDSIPPVPLARRIAKRRLIVDSDEEEIQLTPKTAQRVAVSSPKPDTNAETMTTELGKSRRTYNTRSSTLRSSSTVDSHTDHPETIPMEIKRLSTPPRDEAIHPGPAVNEAKIHLDDAAFLKEAIPDAELLPETTAHGIISTSPVKKNLATGKGTTRRSSPSKLVNSPNLPAKLAGTRRKREDANSPTRGTMALEDNHPPKKKARNTASGDIQTIRDSEAATLPNPFAPSTLSTTTAKTTKKYGKKGKAPSPIPPENVDFDEVPGATSRGKTNARAKVVKASKPVPKKVSAPISGRQTRASVMRRRNEKRPAVELPTGVSAKLESEPEIGIVATPEPLDQIAEVKFPLNDATNDLAVSLKPESASTKEVEKTDMGQASTSTVASENLTNTRNTNAVIIDNKDLAPDRTNPTPKPKMAPWEDPVFITQHALSDEVKPLDISPPDEDPLEPIQDVASEEICEAVFGDFSDYSVSLKGSEDPILPASSDPPPLQLTPRKPPVCIDLTQDPTPVKNGQESAKHRGVAKDVRMLISEGLAENSKKSATFPSALHVTHVTSRQDEHGTRTGASNPPTDDAMGVIMSQDLAPLLKIPPRNEERQEQLAASNNPLVAVRTTDAEGSLTKPRDMRSSPSAPVRRRQSVVSFASPLVTRPISNDVVQASSMTRLTTNVRSNHHGASGNGIYEANARPPKEPVLDCVISLVSDDELESPPARKPSSNRVRFEDVGLPSSFSPLTLKTGSHPVKQMPEKRAKNSPRQNNHHNNKSDEGDDIQGIVDVLSDIQAVIVKGIANKFKSVDRAVRAGREELLCGAVEDLEALADAYARQFNSFIDLEEGYSKHRVAMTRHWEGLIKSSERTQDDLKKALQKHDRNVSSKIFPKSLLPPNSRFSKP